MNLSLPIIQNYLTNVKNDDRTLKHCASLHLPRPVFYASENQLDSNTLYISEAQNLPHKIDFMNGSALICIGEPPKNYYNDDLDLLIIEASTHIFKLSNDLHRIYDYFDSWASSLQKGVNDGKSLQYLCELSEPIFGNAIAVMNADFYIVATTALTSPLADELDKSGALSVSRVNAFKNDENYRNIKTERKVFFYPGDLIPFPTLCKNIFYGEEFIFRIIIMESEHPFRESDPHLLEFFSHSLSQVSEDFSILHKIENKNLATLFSKAIVGDAINQAAFEKELWKIGWSHENCFLLIHIQPSDYDLYVTTLTYFCNKIMQNFNHTFAFINDYTIIVIINITAFTETKEAFLTRFTRFVQDVNFRAGVSNEFQGLNNLKYYSREAEIVLNIGGKSDPTNNLYMFSDYVINYVLNQIVAELPASLLYSPILKRLADYDDKNDTDYLKTIEIYLKNNMNAVKTAKDMFIHRSTIVYRLERIKEIGKTDFKNDDDLLHMHLSLRLAKQHLDFFKYKF